MFAQLVGGGRYWPWELRNCPKGSLSQVLQAIEQGSCSQSIRSAFHSLDHSNLWSSSPGRGKRGQRVVWPPPPGTPDPLCTEDSYLPPVRIPAATTSKLLLEELEHAELKIGKKTALGNCLCVRGPLSCSLSRSWNVSWSFIYLPICEFTVQ